MWLIINEAYLSIVKHNSKENTYLVRAREREHIIDNFGEETLYVIPKADYPYRCNVSEFQLTEFLSHYVTYRLDYTNFKSSLNTEKFKIVCMSIWRFLYDFYENDRPKKERK